MIARNELITLVAITAERLEIYRDYWRTARARRYFAAARSFAKIYWHARRAYKAGMAELHAEDRITDAERLLAR